ncbi:MAG: glycerophosphodiester phosphodiesterase family protein [Rhodothermales bacterium]
MTPLRVPSDLDIQGHRGARGLLPENSIPGFIRALDLGVTTLELDVVISADGQVVVSHDLVMSPVICRHPDGRPVEDDEVIRLYDLDFTEISGYDCGSRAHPSFPDQALMSVGKPLLRDVIRAAERHARDTGREAPRYNVETKSRPDGDGVNHPDPGTFAGYVLLVLQGEGAAERSTLQSFDPRTLAAAAASGWMHDLAILVGEDEAAILDVPDEQWRERLGFHPTILSPNWKLVNERLVARAHEHGMKVIPWTVNNPLDMQRMMSLDVDGLITDYPDRIVHDR